MAQQYVSMEEFINRKTLYVSSIDKKATKIDVKVDLQVICPREVGVVVVPVDQVDTLTLGVAYCNFKTAADAKEAISLHRFTARVRGKLVSLAYSVGKERGRILGAWGNQLTIIVKNLSPEVTEKIFCTKFEKFGEIFRCKVDIDAVGGKYGMAQFTKESSTIRAVECADNKTWFSTIIRVERHARAKLVQEENMSSIPSCGYIESMPSNSTHMNQPATNSNSVSQQFDSWSKDTLPWRARGPQPPPPPTGHPAGLRRSVIQNHAPFSNSFSAASEGYEVTISGSDLHSFQLQERNGEVHLVEDGLDGSSFLEDSPSAPPPVGIIGLMTKQRKLYTNDTSCNSNSVSEAFATPSEDQSLVDAEEAGCDLIAEVPPSHPLPSMGKRSIIPNKSDIDTSKAATKSTSKVKALGLLEAIGQLSNIERAMQAILEPLERISGISHNEGLLYCPITQELFSDPVVAADGHTYERCAIEAWLERSKTSPYTNLELEHTNVIPNILVKKILEELQLVNNST